ncbi:STAS domain-containing protein [Salinimicrobium sp. GXAS 041]|uniref:STAS domain-containing protein n=1 Tax=Salinimicrobium sp. GXAS 041 TaxID=3400806 RepID=UPI003C74894F
MEIVKKGLIINLVGALDSENVSEIELHISDQLNQTDHLIINVDHLSCIESSGFYMLYLIKQKAERLGKTVSFQGSENSIYKRKIHKYSFAALLNS